ncbi:MAG: 50S ribosomal protein L22 [Candidatus Omnitrophota bacterium]
MLARAVLRYVRVSPKKTRLVIDAVRGKSVEEAIGMLANVNKKASEYLRDVIKSAVNNVKVKYPDQKYPEDALFISKITADGGPSLVRYRAASMGRATMIRKRMSHITVELDAIPERMAEIQAESGKKTKTVRDKDTQPAAKGKKKLAAKGTK